MTLRAMALEEARRYARTGQQIERKILFPSEVSQSDPELSFDECIRIADVYNRNDVKASTIDVSSGLPATKERVPVRHSYLSAVGMMFLVALPILAVLDGRFAGIVAMIVGLIAFFGTYTVFHKLYSRTVAKTIDVKPSVGIGTMSEKALAILREDGFEDRLGLSRSEMYDRIEFLKNYRKSNIEMMSAYNSLKGTEHEHKALTAINDNSERFKQYATWLNESHILSITDAKERAAAQARDKALKVIESARY